MARTAARMCRGSRTWSKTDNFATNRGPHQWPRGDFSSGWSVPSLSSATAGGEAGYADSTDPWPSAFALRAFETQALSDSFACPDARPARLGW